MSAAHERIEPFRCHETGAFLVWQDAGKWWIGGIAKKLVVVRAEHGHLFRYREFRLPARFKHLYRSEIPRHIDGYRLGKR